MTISSAAAQSVDIGKIDAKTAGLLDFIGNLEAPSGYNAYSSYAAAPPPRPLTSMTVSEVLAWQDSIDAKSRSEAAGRYQIMEDTLRGLVSAMGLSGREYFTPGLQNAMALYLMKRRGWHPANTNLIAVANRLAKEWAALPVVSGPNKGHSFYRRSRAARNRAQTTPEIFLNVLANGADRSLVSNAVVLSRARRRITLAHSAPQTPTQQIIKGGGLTPSKVIVFANDPFKLD